MKRKSSRTIRMGAVAFLIAVLTPAVAAAAAITGTCQPAKVAFSASPMTGGDVSTTSRTFVSVPEAIVNFVQGGTEASCVIVQFTAKVSGSNDTMFIRALLDGNVVAQPGYTDSVRAMNFIFPLVKPGSHVIQMQYRALVGGSTGRYVTMGRHTTIVQYAP